MKFNVYKLHDDNVVQMLPEAEATADQCCGYETRVAAIKFFYLRLKSGFRNTKMSKKKRLHPMTAYQW